MVTLSRSSLSILLYVVIASARNPASIFNLPQCNFVLEVVYVQDFSDSFSDDISELSVNLPLIFDNINQQWPGSTFGVASFVDKPIAPFGFPPEEPWFQGDWCLNVTSPISAHEGIIPVLLSGNIGGGNDWEENQLGVLHDLARNASLAGWSDVQHNSEGFPVVRVIVMSTDSGYHKAGDGTPLTLVPNNGDGYTDCTNEDYPSISQVGQALSSRLIYTVFLLGQHPTEDVTTIYSNLLQLLGTPGAAHTISSDSNDIIDTMAVAIDNLASKTCTTPTLDFVLSQDVTWSYRNDFEHLHERMKTFAQAVQGDYILPRFGLATFGDKPLSPLGSNPSGDYCYRLEQTLSSNITDVMNAAKKVAMTSGLDWKESQLDGMISAVVDPNMNWREGDLWNGFPVVRVVALATDSGYHTAPDASNAGHLLSGHSGSMVQCTTEEYPDWHQLAEVLLAKRVHPLFIPTSDIARIYTKLVDDMASTYGIIGRVIEIKDFGNLSAAMATGVKMLAKDVQENGKLLKFTK